MSQDIFTTIDPNETDGTELAEMLVDFKNAYVSGNAGTSRPASLHMGGTWVDVTDPDKFILKMFNGIVDTELLTIDRTYNTSIVKRGQDTFEIVERNNTANGPKFVLSKRRTTGYGQDGDELGEIVFTGRNNSGMSVETVSISVQSVGGLPGNSAKTELKFKNRNADFETLEDKFIIGDILQLIGDTTVTGNLTITGIPTAPTAPSGTSNAQLATTKFVTDFASDRLRETRNRIALTNNTLNEIPVIGGEISALMCVKVSAYIYRKTNAGNFTLSVDLVLEGAPDNTTKWSLVELNRSENFGDSGITFSLVEKSSTKSLLGISLDDRAGTDCVFHYNITNFEV